MFPRFWVSGYMSIVDSTHPNIPKARMRCQVHVAAGKDSGSFLYWALLLLTQGEAVGRILSRRRKSSLARPLCSYL